MIPLEDDFSDVLGKAMRGHRLSPEALAQRAGVPPEEVASILQGEYRADAVHRLSACLHLVPERVAALGEKRYTPEPVSLPGLYMVQTAFGSMMVYAYLVWDEASRIAALFDTGSDGDALLDFARARSLRIQQIFITHGHGDHIFDLDRLVEKTRALAWAPSGEGVPTAQGFRSGATFAIGALTVETRSTHGHCADGVTYVVHGLERPLALCGDALFAGSMGGGGVSYDDALRTNREALFTLPDEAVLAPGHGPLTTVGEQRRVNPFFPPDSV